MSTPEENEQKLAAIKLRAHAYLETPEARANRLELRVAELEKHQAEAEKVTADIDAQLKKIAPRLTLAEQLELSGPLYALNSIFHGAKPRVSAVVKLPSLRIVRVPGGAA